MTTRMEAMEAAIEKLGFGRDLVSEDIGWRGTYPKPSTDDHYRCEFCAEEHLDATQIPHKDGCPVLLCRAALSLPREGEAVAASEDCERCCGNGEIVTDWERYLHAHDGDVGDEATEDCPDCGGTGKVDHPAPSAEGALREGRESAQPSPPSSQPQP